MVGIKQYLINYKKWLVILLTALIGITVYFSEFVESTEFNQQQLNQLSEEQWFNIDSAEKMRHESYGFLVGVVDDEKFLSLLKHAFMGDKNALLQVAITRLEDQEVIADPYFYGEGSKSRVSQFIKKYKNQLVSDKGTRLIEPPLLKKDPWAMIKEMADSGHSESTFHYLLRRILDDVIYKQLTNEERQTGLHYLEHLIEVKKYKRWASQEYGDLSIFENSYAIYSGTTESPSRLRTLSEKRAGLTEMEETKAIEMYRVCAMDGVLACATHLTEAYATGIGVKQDWIQAYAWARVVNFVQFSFAEDANKKGDKREIQIISSMNKLALAVIKEGEQHLTAPEKLSAQKIANKLIEEINFR